MVRDLSVTLSDYTFTLSAVSDIVSTKVISWFEFHKLENFAALFFSEKSFFSTLKNVVFIE